MKQTEITDKESNQRFDKYLIKYFNKAPKSFIYKMLRKKRIKLNMSLAQGNELLKAGDIVSFYLADDTMESFMEERTVNPASDLDIIFEDANIIVCNKPQGVLTHSESSDDSDTMVDRLLFYLHEKNEYITDKASSFTPAVCNRLDRNTSGIILCGKNLASVQALNKMTAQRKTDKYYFAMVVGRIDKPRVLKGSYEKDTGKNYATIKNKADASDVLTELKPLKISDAYTLLELRLFTGKSHQIRAHLASIGNPVAGDPKYGDKNANSFLFKQFGIKYQLLHATRLKINEPEGHLGYLCGKEFLCDIPPNFNKAVKHFFVD